MIKSYRNIKTLKPPVSLPDTRRVIIYLVFKGKVLKAPYYTLLHRVTLCCTVLHFVALCYTLLHRITLCCTILHAGLLLWMFPRLSSVGLSVAMVEVAVLWTMVSWWYLSDVGVGGRSWCYSFMFLYGRHVVGRHPLWVPPLTPEWVSEWVSVCVLCRLAGDRVTHKRTCKRA
jgi:hypothetical protein